jgi:hypothetical protein
MPEQTLSPAQRAQIAAWLDEGFTNPQIIRKVEAARDRCDEVGDTPWPRVSRGLVDYYRHHRGEAAPDMPSGISVASGTMLGSRTTNLRRVASVAGDLEEIMDLLREQILHEYAAGALLARAPGVALDGTKPGAVIDARYAVDGVAVIPSGLGDITLPEPAEPDTSRAERAIAMTLAYARLADTWEKLMRNAQRVALLHVPATKDDAKKSDDAANTEYARRLVEIARNAQPRHAG